MFLIANSCSDVLLLLALQADLFVVSEKHMEVFSISFIVGEWPENGTTEEVYFFW